jgi:hypothetical protein
VQQLAYWYPVDEPPPLPLGDDAVSTLSSSFAASTAASTAASAAASTSSVSSNASATMAAEHAHSMGVVVHVIKSARALLRAHAIASSDAVRSQHLDAALALLGTARDSTEASTAESDSPSDGPLMSL